MDLHMYSNLCQEGSRPLSAIHARCMQGVAKGWKSGYVDLPDLTGRQRLLLF